MGKSYSYSIVVGQGGTLLINDQEIPLPAEVASSGDDPLGWALDQVRESYSSYYAQNQGSELNLSVRDRRPGGLVRRAKFTHPDSGIDLDTFLGNRRRGSVEHSAAPLTADAPPAAVTQSEPEAEHSVQPQATAGDQEEASRAQGKELTRREARSASTVATTVTPEAPAEATQSYEDRVREERGWRKLPKEKSTRPQVGSAENEGRSKKLGLLAEAQKQKTLRIVGIVVVVIAVIVGFRLLNGGTEYEAFCVDQRTMTRTVTGVACENESDTNHRWWFTAEAEDLPSPGDSIDTQDGTFDEPSNDKDTINWHVENEEFTG